MLEGAIVGFGRVAEKAHAPAWVTRKDFSIVAVAEPEPKRQGIARRFFPGARFYASAEELLETEKNLDFVDIATPPFLHPRQAALALRGGCHVLCEKPLALSRSDFENLRSLARKKNLALFTVHNWKYAPLFRKLRALLAREAIGPLWHIELHTLRNQPSAAETAWRTDKKLAGGGILVDHGWHQFYLLTWLLQRSPRRAAGLLDILKSGAEESAHCVIDYSGVDAGLYLSWRAGRRAHWGLVRGRSGEIEIKDDALVLRPAGKPTSRFAFPEPLSRGSAHPDWFAAMLDDFKAAVLHSAPRRQNLAEAGACVWLLGKLYNRAGS